MDSQSCFFLWLHGQLTHRNTYVTIFLSKKYWSFFAPMTRRRETSSLSIWRERDLSVVKSRITHVAELAGYVTVLPGCMITVSHPVKNKIWIGSAVETSGFHHQNNEHSVYWRQSDYNQWSAVISNLEGTVQYEVNNIKQAQSISRIGSLEYVGCWLKGGIMTGTFPHALIVVLVSMHQYNGLPIFKAYFVLWLIWKLRFILV